METLKEPKKKSQRDQTCQNKATEKSPTTQWWVLISIAILILLGLAGKKKAFLVSTDQGMKIASWRQKKLEKELKNFDKAEQYVLVATVEGEYPCFNCEGQATIHLKVGEIWKYGVTRIEKDKRYGSISIDPRLRYLVEYKGDIGTCLRMEKVKIYEYAELPENLRREKPLIRPPGNKNDS